MQEENIGQKGKVDISLKLSKYWKEKLACPECRLSLKPLELKKFCERCGFHFGLNDGVLQCGSGDEFYDEHGFTRTGKNFEDNLFGRLSLYYARQHHLYYISKLVPRDSALIELGCGGGSRFLASQYEILGVELSSTSTRQITGIYESVIQSSAISIPVADQSADAIVSSFLLEHLDEANAFLVIQEMYRVLKPNGVMIHYFDLDSNGPFFQWAKKQLWYQDIFIDSRGHIGLRSFKEWEEIFTKVGFKIEKKKFSCKTWLQDLSIWASLDNPSVKGKPKLFGKFAALVSRKFGRIGQVLFTIMDDCIENVFPDCWAAKVILVLRKP